MSLSKHTPAAYTPPVSAPLPIIKAPTAATEVKRAFHHPGWVYEEKVDGWRVLAYKDRAGVRRLCASMDPTLYSMLASSSPTL